MRTSVRRKLYRLFKPKRARVDGIVVDMTSDAIVPRVGELLVFGGYERAERVALKHVLRPGDRVLELGGGLGVLSALSARIVGSEAVMTVEASPYMQDIIRRTHDLNGVSPTLINAAAGASDGQVTFHVDQVFWGSSTLPGDARSTSIVVTQVSLDRLLSEHNATVVVCDIEGGEAELGPILARRTDLRGVVMELHPHLLGASACTAIVGEFIRNGWLIDFRRSGTGVMLFERPADPSAIPQDGASAAVAWHLSPRQASTAG